MSCDFCSWGDPIWSYPCKDFESEKFNIEQADTTLSLASFKQWLACYECSDLIEEENFDELMERAFRSAIPPESNRRLTNEQRTQLKRWVRNTHLEFMKNRTGPREPWKE